ncbi:flagellar biosynthetic protein FliO [Xanthobacter tagetidis]|nr:flagellar biosynthetic protein FliO [Xanthobacter tagetidis]MBB6310098.1 Meckel syndrome type 1 protein [Xanthobacter tagetidis]
MLQQIFGTQLDFPVRLGVAILVIAVLLGATVMLMRAIGGRRAIMTRGRSGPRLTLVDSLNVDARRKLMLVRRDDVEHLILIGGTSDIVVEADIGKAEAVAVAQPAFETREPAAPAAQIQAPQARPALAREPAAPRIAPAPALDALPAAEAAVPAPEEAPAQEIRRPMPARRPLPRSDGSLSGRPATPAPAPAPRPSLSRGTAAAMGRSTSAPAHEPQAERRPALERPALVPLAAAPETVPTADAARAAVVAVAPEPAPKPEPDFDDIAQKLDLALAEPAAEAPRLSLSDLLDEPAEPAAPAQAADRIEIDLVSELAAELDLEVIGAQAEATDEAPTVAAEAPKVEAPKMEAPEIVVSEADTIESAEIEPPLAAAPVERPRERLRDIRPVLPAAGERPERTERPRLEPAPRLEPSPRPDFAPREPSVREPSVREPGQRPREFAFRPSDAAARPPREALPREAPPREVPARETPRLDALRRPAAEPGARPALDRASPDRPALERPSLDRGPSVARLREPLRRDAERKPDEAPARPAPLSPPRRWESPPVAARPEAEPAAPVVKAEKPSEPPPSPANDPFNDLDSEMANLLGRGSGR